jgi:hypothetical protein
VRILWGKGCKHEMERGTLNLKDLPRAVSASVSYETRRRTILVAVEMEGRSFSIGIPAGKLLLAVALTQGEIEEAITVAACDIGADTSLAWFHKGHPEEDDDAG